MATWQQGDWARMIGGDLGLRGSIVRVERSVLQRPGMAVRTAGGERMAVPEDWLAPLSPSLTFSTPDGRAVNVFAETSADADELRWKALVDGELENLVRLTDRQRNGTPEGSAPHSQPWTAGEIVRGVRKAVEVRLVSPSVNVPGKPIDVLSQHLYEANEAL